MLAFSEGQKTLFAKHFESFLSIYVYIYIYILLGSGWRKSWGTGRDCPLKSFNWGTAVLTVPPPKFKFRRDTAGSCFVRSHKEYVTHYSFESNQRLLSYSPPYAF